MKKILIIMIISFVLIPLKIKANTIDDIYNNIEIQGINKDEYNITKTINDNNIIVVLKNKKNNEYYSWSFDKNKITGKVVLDFNIDFTSKKETEIKAITGNIKKKSISFEQHGTLPSDATIKVYVGDTYKNGDKLYLYYYNENNNKVQFIAKNIIVKDGYAKFNIKHCSEYFLTSAIVNHAIDNPKIGRYVIIVLSIIAFIILVAVVTRK